MELIGHSRPTTPKESYAKNYSTVFPHDEPLAGRNAKTDPLHGELLEAGCVFQERLGWERPGWFARKEGEGEGESSPPLPYDWYGAYGEERHEDYRYDHKLRMDYTFGHPKHHENVSSCVLLLLLLLLLWLLLFLSLLIKFLSLPLL